MRNFRYIEPGHGRKSLTEKEIDNAYIYLDIRTDGYYALMPVTKAEFNLLDSMAKRMDWKPGMLNIPIDKPYKFNVGDKVVMDPKNKHISGWKDWGVGEVVERLRHTPDGLKGSYRFGDNTYCIVWAGMSAAIAVFEDSLMPAPDLTCEKSWKPADDPIRLSDEVVRFIRDAVEANVNRKYDEVFAKVNYIKDRPETNVPGETMNISSVVAERFIQMDQEIQGFIREEVKAELNRREEEDDDSYYNVL